MKSTGNQSTFPLKPSSIGTIKDVLVGRAPAHLPMRDASDVMYGFEAGSTRSRETLGEMVIYDGIAYCCETDAENITRASSKYLSPCVFVIPKGCQPSRQIKIEAPTSVDTIYAAIHDPVALAGRVRFQSLDAKIITAPPIDDEPILEHLDKYYAKDPFHFEDVEGVIVGVGGDYGLDDLVYNSKSHTHVLVFENGKPKHAMHLIESSIIASATLDVFALNNQ